MSTVGLRSPQGPKVDYYAVLGLEPTATKREVKSAYRKLMRKHHPDNMQERFDPAKVYTINEAFAVLSDPDKRCEYDTECGHTEVSDSVAASSVARFTRAHKVASVLIESASRSRAKEEEVKTVVNGRPTKGGGLMIIKAQFGTGTHHMDVTNPLQCLVVHRGKNMGGYIEIEAGIDKRLIAGFAAPIGLAVGQVYLEVQYLFNLTMHRVRVHNFEQLLIPIEAHALTNQPALPADADQLQDPETPHTEMTLVSVEAKPRTKAHSFNKVKFLMLVTTALLVAWIWWGEEEQRRKKADGKNPDAKKAS